MRWLLVAIVAWARSAAADTDCRAVELDFTPSPGLQIVAWIEEASLSLRD